jgi:hypothetical protein
VTLPTNNSLNIMWARLVSHRKICGDNGAIFSNNISKYLILMGIFTLSTALLLEAVAFPHLISKYCLHYQIIWFLDPPDNYYPKVSWCFELLLLLLRSEKSQFVLEHPRRFFCSPRVIVKRKCYSCKKRKIFGEILN